MSNFFEDFVEYAPFLLLLGGCLLFWGLLCASSFFSLRAATRRRRFWLALPPVLLGLPFLWGDIPISIEAERFRFRADLRWLFIVPVVLGIAGLVLWWRSRRGTPV